MQTQDQRETTSENSQTSSVVIEEDKPTENEHKSDVETPKPEEKDEPQAQMQTLITQMREL